MTTLKYRGFLYLLIFSIFTIIFKLVSHEMDWAYESFGETMDPATIPMVILGIYLFIRYFDQKKRLIRRTSQND